MQYGQPRRLNALTVVLIMLALGAGYWMWKFFPAYFDAWTVDHILKEGASSVYSANSLREPERGKAFTAIGEKARKQVQEQANISDPDLEINLDIDGNVATMTAAYSVVVEHPVIGKSTTLHFKRVVSADIKAVNWD